MKTSRAGDRDRTSDDEKIVVDDVEIPPDESGGGFDGNVSDWDDETNVELPVG